MQLIDNMFYFNLIIDYIEIKMMAYDFFGQSCVACSTGTVAKLL